MKVLMVFDQIQAGMGGKERAGAELPLGGKRGPIGAVPMLEPHLKKLDEEVIACLYCGDGYFKEHEEEVVKKMAAMAKKLRPDVVICGPAYNYKGFARMCALVAYEINKKTDIPAIAAMSEENADTISKYKNSVNIVKMPKKGGTGLNESLYKICLLAKKVADKEDITELKKEICY